MRWKISAVAVMLLGVLVGCGGGAPEPEPGALEVVATTTVVADLVRHVAGENVALVSLMGPGVDPHLYKPSAGDVRRMGSARIVFYNGLHLEGKMGEVLAQMGSRGVETVAVAGCLPESTLIASEAFSGVHDPHVWFDVGLWRQAADCVRDALVEVDPANAEGYRSRADSYVAELSELDAWVRQQIERVRPENRVLVTAHDAFSYFGRAYGIEVRGLMGISTAAEAATADVQQLAEFIAERRVPAIFLESSVTPRYIEALRQAVVARGFDVALGGSLYSDALGDPGGSAGTYVGMVRANVETIVAALAGEQG